MKIQIFGSPRSGTTCLYEAFRDSINYTMGIFEPLTPSWNYQLYYNKSKIKNHINTLNNNNLNIIEKNVLWDDNVIKDEIYREKILNFYISYFKNFDKLIFLYRKNIDENAKSLATAILTDNFHQPYKGINVDYTPFLPLLKSKNKMVEDLASYFNTPITYYEDLYSNNTQYINSFLDNFDIKVTNPIQCYHKLNTQNRLKQLR